METKGKKNTGHEPMWLRQNQKTLRFRAGLAQLAVVCVHLRNINGELLTPHFCQFIKNSVGSLNRFQEAIQAELKKQSLSKISLQNKRNVDTYSTTSSRQLIHQRYAPLRTRLLGSVHIFCETFLNELHQLNYEHLSESTYKILGEVIDFFTNFKNEINKEQEAQNINKSNTRISREAS